MIRSNLTILADALPRQPKNKLLSVALVNYYPNGRYYMGAHNDNAAAMGSDHYIMSVSFGMERPFVLEQTSNTCKHKLSYDLPNGMVVAILGPTIQQKWKHSVPRDDSIVDERWNLSFRYH